MFDELKGYRILSNSQFVKNEETQEIERRFLSGLAIQNSFVYRHFLVGNCLYVTNRQL